MSVRGLLFYRAELEAGSRDATAPLVPVEKDVFDGRQVPDGFFSLDTSYFKLVQHTSAVHDLPDGLYSSQEDMQRVYYPELEVLLKRETGATHAFVVGHLAREAHTPQSLLQATDAATKDLSHIAAAAIRGGDNSSGASRFGISGRPENQMNGSAALVHTDYEWNHKDRMIEWFTPGSDRHCEGGLAAWVDPRSNPYYDLHARTGLTSQDLCRCRIQVVNVWRAAEDFPLKRMPLALADQRTVSHLDAVSTPNEFNTHGAHGRVITLRPNNNFPTAVHTEKHTYWYFPDLQRDEAVLLKTYDSIDYDRGADYRMCWHTGFHDPTTPPECGPRHSCEARVVLITPYSDDGDHEYWPT